ncbi:hypothetical protein [Hymenobacter cellulosilyticus]|uniref:Uncharacterized protein n=1 Tax=Hymenobacter cellulosilyticus TaxID=2932248 RepID=A0A8T9QB89_9BACT|nr:hypothetical protein [Hymenobacter cellulosilyticus]UOQ74816.1 hypothetical protein MUN79_13655 [Hymenobacter cellulosilyticus]
MDWDVLPEAGRNAAAWDSVRTLGYAYDRENPTVYVGVKLLQGGTASCYSINNNAGVGTPCAWPMDSAAPKSF